jgi:hypothetical protein
MIRRVLLMLEICIALSLAADVFQPPVARGQGEAPPEQASPSGETDTSDARGVWIVEGSRDLRPSGRQVVPDPDMLARVLTGLRVKQGARMFSRVLGGIFGGGRETRVFSRDDVDYLSPLLASALARTTGRQIVRFRVVQSTAGRSKATEGIVWIDGPALHLALTKYLADLGRRQSISRKAVYQKEEDPRDDTGLKNLRLGFFPSAGVEISNADLPIAAPPDLATVTISYDVLVAGTPTPPRGVTAPPPAARGTTAP